MKTTSVLLIIILLNADALFAQDTGREIYHAITFKSRFIQLKDEFNYGLVHNGLYLGGEYSMNSETDKAAFIYKAGFDFGASYKKGLGMIWSFSPFDLYYGLSLNRDPEMKIKLGPYTAGYYKWQLYPELQSGKLFWISSYEVGPRLLISLPYKNKIFSASVSGSIVSLNSRPKVKTEEYFYSLKLGDFIRNPHSNMTVGLQNVFNHVDVILELKDRDKRRSICYEFEYISYASAPAFKYITHCINLKWRIGNNKLK
jgi:hypothetical protein